MEKLLSVQQVADAFGMHPKTLYKLIRENKIALNFIRLHDRMIAFRPSDVRDFIDRREVVRTGAGKKRKVEKLLDAEIMADQEAQAFFANVERNAEGQIILHYKDSEYPEE